jgi:hypothetical protein
MAQQPAYPQAQQSINAPAKKKNKPKAEFAGLGFR